MDCCGRGTPECAARLPGYDLPTIFLSPSPHFVSGFQETLSSLSSVSNDTILRAAISCSILKMRSVLFMRPPPHCGHPCCHAQLGIRPPDCFQLVFESRAELMSALPDVGSRSFISEITTALTLKYLFNDKVGALPSPISATPTLGNHILVFKRLNFI